MITHRSGGDECSQTLKSTRTRSENRGMRWPLPLLLALSGLGFASVEHSLPRGNDSFRLAMDRAQVDSAVAARGVRVLSAGNDYLACVPHDPTVEFEQYAFVPSPQGPGYLWRVTIAYRVPYRRAVFDSLRQALARHLGEPAEDVAPRDSTEVHRATWVDPMTSVQLAARWPEHPDPRSDRMLVTWTDRRLQKLVEAKRMKERKAR